MIACLCNGYIEIPVFAILVACTTLFISHILGRWRCRHLGCLHNH